MSVLPGRTGARRAVELGERLGTLNSRLGGHLALGVQQLLDGEATAAVATLESAVSFGSVGAGTQIYALRTCLAEAYLADRQVARAHAIAEDCGRGHLHMTCGVRWSSARPTRRA